MKKYENLKEENISDINVIPDRSPKVDSTNRLGGSIQEFELLPVTSDVDKGIVDETSAEIITSTVSTESESLSVRSEAGFLLRRSIPVSLSTLCRILIPLCDSIVIGHLTSEHSDYLAAESLGRIILYMLFVIPWGVASTLNTLCANSIGAGNHRTAGVWLQIAVLLIFCCCIPTLIIVNFSLFSILTHLQYEERVVENAVVFVLISSIGFVPQSILLGIQQYLQAIHCNTPVTIIYCIALPLDIALNILLVWGIGSWDGLGFIGTPLAWTISEFFMLFATILYCFVYKGFHKYYWPDYGFSFKKSYKWLRVKEFVVLAIPSAMATALNDYGYELVMFFAPASSVAAQGILFNYWLFAWSLVFGISVVAQVRIGFFLGAGDPIRAKFTFWIAFGISASLSCFLAVLMISSTGSDWMPRVFTDEQTTINTVKDCILLFSFSLTLAMFSDLGFSVMEGVGWPLLLVPVMLLSSAGVLIPLTYVFSIQMEMGLRGAWWASLLSESLKIILIFPLLLFFINWKSASDAAVLRSDAYQGQESSSDMASVDEGDDDTDDSELETRTKFD